MDTDSSNVLFLAALTLSLAGVLPWALRSLAAERWQMAAAVPLRKGADGAWEGLNLTYYGFFTATANALAVALFLTLSGAVGVGCGRFLLLVTAIFGVALPAARWIARYVENKPNTFTVGGASFAGMAVLPWAMVGLDAVLGTAGGFEILPMLAAAATAYALGEGIGRLACISFGCCYGKPLSGFSPAVRRWLGPLSVVFYGARRRSSATSLAAGRWWPCRP